MERVSTPWNDNQCALLDQATQVADAGTLYAVRDRLADTLFAHRKDREPPLRDEKIITAWNGLMISAFAEASDTLGDTRYQDAAIQAAKNL